MTQQDANIKGGVGTEFKAILLARYGIGASKSCGCEWRAKEMDRKGIAWCECNAAHLVDKIIEAAKNWSRTNSKTLWESFVKAGLPWIPTAIKKPAIRSLLKEAIAVAKSKLPPVVQLVDCDHCVKAVCIHPKVKDWKPEVCFGCGLRTIAAKRKLGRPR